MRQALIDQWGPEGENITITTFYGDGKKGPDRQDLPEEWNAKRASKKAIEDFLEELAPKLNPNEQFFFYATGHGGSSSKGNRPKSPPAPKDEATDGFELTPGELDALTQEPDNEPTLTIEYEDLTDATEPVFVSLNGIVLGSLDVPLDPGVWFTELAVPESILAGTNTVTIYNGTNVPFALSSIEFFTGGINDGPVPEPSTPLLLMLGGGLIVRRRAA